MGALIPSSGFVIVDEVKKWEEIPRKNTSNFLFIKLRPKRIFRAVIQLHFCAAQSTAERYAQNFSTADAPKT